MNCPVCDWDMSHTPDDQIVNWTCKRGNCGFMATDNYMNNLTDDDLIRIKKSADDTKIWREEQKAKREIQSIERTRKRIQREKEDSESVHDIARRYKKISSLDDFNG